MAGVRYFVLLYDRTAGRVVELNDYSDRDDAARFARWLESGIEKYKGNAEVLLLAAPSREAIRETHSRYFASARELSGSSRFRAPQTAT